VRGTIYVVTVQAIIRRNAMLTTVPRNAIDNQSSNFGVMLAKAIGVRYRFNSVAYLEFVRHNLSSSLSAISQLRPVLSQF
jgi:hypothetical protein